ncbi:MAG: hypothetical protein Q9202_006125 [Teloschistes flavicans]
MDESDLEAGVGTALASDNLLPPVSTDDSRKSEVNAVSHRSIRSLLHRFAQRTHLKSLRLDKKPTRRDSRDGNNFELTVTASSATPIALSAEEPPIADTLAANIPTSLQDTVDDQPSLGSAHIGSSDGRTQIESGGEVHPVTQTLGEECSIQASTQYRPTMDTPSSDYKRKVNPMSEQEIGGEDEWRMRIREKWRSGDWKSTEFIEDPWAALWEKRPDASRGLFLWSCSDEERKELQFDLIDALNSAPVHEDWPSRGLRAISSWISLIGLRLNDFYLKHWFPTQEQSADEIDSPIKQVRVLIECIWTCNKSREATIGNVLESCYRRSVLRQPIFTDGLETKYSVYLLRKHLRAVRLSIHLVSILYRHNFPEIKKDEDLSSAWSTSISDAEVKMRPEQPSVEIDRGKQPFLAVGDLNVRDLQTIGQLRIQWTPYWDEHLQLETLWTKNILKLYWFSPNGFTAAPEEQVLSNFRLPDDPDEKVGEFWAFCLETRDHILEDWPANLPHDRITISRFPRYHERLRELRIYMDSQQPKGLRDMWKDRRNSNTFWTFWFVVIFGALSVSLGFGALVAGAIGTWAQLKSLHQGPDG